MEANNAFYEAVHSQIAKLHDLDNQLDTATTRVSEAVGQVVNKVGGLAAVTEQGLQVIKQAQDASTNAFNSFTKSELPQILENKLQPVVAKIGELASATEGINSKVGTILTRWPTRDRPAFTPAQQAQVFLCMRALNRVEDLTVDKEPGRTDNNTTLRRIRDDTLVRDCLAVLHGAEALQNRVTMVHKNFTRTKPEEETQERLERFLEIQELRQAIVAHFAAQPPAAPDSPPPADEQSTQD